MTTKKSKYILKFMTATFPIYVLIFFIYLYPGESNKTDGIYMDHEIPLNDHHIKESTPIIIDLHADTITKVLRTGDIPDFSGRNYHASLPHLKEGKINALFFALWGEESGREFPFVEKQIDFFNKVIERYSEDIAFAGGLKDLKKNVAAGKISGFLGVEGGAVIGNNVNNIDYLFNRGIRYMTLTWNHSNKIADASKDSSQPHGGLSSFGERVVERMNKVGMIIDISHASDSTVKDVLALSKDPIIASHSCCYSLRAHKRNLKDQLIEDICSNGGVIGVNFYKSFLTKRNVAYVADVVNHIDHVKKTGGINCVALGSDFDGGIRTPVGLENAGKIGNLTKELTKRGYTKGEIEKIFGLNFIRVLFDVVDKKNK